MMAVIMVALEVKIGGLAQVPAPLLWESRAGLRKVKIEPQGKGGGGWVSPSTVANSYDDEVSPRVARDGYGVLWAVLNDKTPEFPYMNLYYSTDNGLTWNYYTTVQGDSCSMFAPSLVYEPSQGVLVMAFVGVEGDSCKVGICAWDVAGEAQLDSFRYTCVYGVGDVCSPALAVEKGQLKNATFCAFKYVEDTTQYVIVYRCTDLDTFNWECSTCWSATNYYLGGIAANASDRVVQVTFRGGSDPQNPTVAYYAYSTDRGSSWNLASLDVSSVGTVGFSSSAAAAGSDYAVWAVQVNEDLYLLYSQDLGASWPWGYWLEASADSAVKMPLLLADESGKGASAYFYLLAYRDGNIWMRMVRVGEASDAGAWVPPAGKDEFLIPEADLGQYSVWDTSWPSQLHGVAVPEAGGSGLVVVWSHEYSTGDRDVVFSRSDGALFMSALEGEAPSGPRLLTPFSKGELRFLVPEELRGSPLLVYDAKGSLVLKTKLTPLVRVELPQGVYAWRAGGRRGKFVLRR